MTPPWSPRPIPRPASGSPSSEVQNGLDKLQAQGAVRASAAGLGYRSAFVGAVLATLPGAQVSLHPATITLSSSTAVQGASDPVFGVLDGVAAVKVRKEQAALRNLLAGNRQQAPCALCGDEYPMGFLVAAHVKKRALCSDDERRDLHHVAMLACVFGCDALYEAGWITVGGHGRVQTVPLASAPEGQVRQRLQRLAGRQCLAHSPASAGYFTWHRTTMFRDRITGRLDTDPPAAR